MSSDVFGGLRGLVLREGVARVIVVVLLAIVAIAVPVGQHVVFAGELERRDEAIAAKDAEIKQYEAEVAEAESAVSEAMSAVESEAKTREQESASVGKNAEDYAKKRAEEVVSDLKGQVDSLRTELEEQKRAVARLKSELAERQKIVDEARESGVL